MSYRNSYSRKPIFQTCAFALATAVVSCMPAAAASFSTATFATGTGLTATAPDSVTYGNGSLWIEYGNGASSTDYTGSSTIVQYNAAGSVQNTYKIAGSVDGLKFDPNTGMVWALQNQDALSRLTIINPSSKMVNSYTYGAPYPSASGTRGFDDVAFIGGNVYLSFSNPTKTSDAVVLMLNNSNPASPIGLTTIQTGVGVNATDPDSLKSTPTGGLLLSGGDDKTLTFINNPGQANQSARSIVLNTAKGPDDSVYATASSGVFYLTDTGTNNVLAVSATGLVPGTLFANVGTAFGMVDPLTGDFTAILNGTSLHGAIFVATPEPSTFGIAILGAGLIGFFLYRRRRVSNA